MTIDYELDGHIAVITINRPEARNAVNRDVAEGIEAAIDRLEEDDEAWIGIITGARTDKGFIFSAGADLKAMTTDAGGMMTKKGGFAGLVQRERSKPIIAAVDGPAARSRRSRRAWSACHPGRWPSASGRRLRRRSSPCRSGRR